MSRDSNKNSSQARNTIEFLRNTKLFSIYLGFTFLAVVFIPITISWDGVLYLASGKSLFGSDFPSWYLLMKEPGYPFLIWVSNLTGNSLFTLSIIQAAEIAAAGALMEKVILNLFALRTRTVRLFLFLGIILVRGYAVAVLQQTSFMLFFAAGTYMIHQIYFKGMNRKNAFLLFFLGFLSATISVAIPMILILSLLLMYVFKILNFRAAAASGLLISLGLILFAIPWFSFTQSVDLAKQQYPSCRNSFCISGFAPNATLLERGDQVIASVPALLYIGKETYFSHSPETYVAQTALAYGDPVISMDDSCIRLQEHNEHMYQFVAKSVHYFCAPPFFRKAENSVSNAFIPIFPLCGYAFLTLLVIAFLWRSREFGILLSVISATVLAYSWSGAGISRYNPLLALLGPLFIYLAITSVNRNRLIRQMTLD